ncbi:MAG: hypothetical protein GC159_03515 [Phycisphaera sp.]|nr:hypothetical protein [Phycisphaera sp.]
MPKPRDPRNPKDAYAAARRDIDRLMGWLTTRLDEHGGTDFGDKDWADVGDLRKVRSDLCQTLAFIANVETVDIERMLTPRK